MAPAFVSSLKNLGQFFANHPLTRDDRLGAWARFANWQIRSRMQGEVVVPWIEGTQLAVRRGMLGATGNVYVGLHEFVDMMLPLHFLREGDLFLDIGANVGSYTVLASGVRRAITWAFEPDPDTARALRRNVALNNMVDRVVIHELALGDHDGTVTFTRGLDTVNHVATADDVNVRHVPLRRLDSFADGSRPAMIKIDVEGFEAAVIDGAGNLLAGDSLKLIELETVTDGIETALIAHNFERAYYDPFRRTLAREPIGGLHASNIVFVRDMDFVRSRLVSAPRVEVHGKSI